MSKRLSRLWLVGFIRCPSQTVLGYYWWSPVTTQQPVWRWLFGCGSLGWINRDKALVPGRGSHCARCLLSHFPYKPKLHEPGMNYSPNSCHAWPLLCYRGSSTDWHPPPPMSSINCVYGYNLCRENEWVLQAWNGCAFLFKDKKGECCTVGLASILSGLVFVPVFVGRYQRRASLIGTAACSILYFTHKTWALYHCEPSSARDWFDFTQWDGWHWSHNPKEKLILLSLSRVVEAGFWISIALTSLASLKKTQ